MVNTHSKVNVSNQTEPRYSLTIEGLTQDEVNRLHAVFNHVRICEFVDGGGISNKTTTYKIRRALQSIITKDVFCAFDGVLRMMRS